MDNDTLFEELAELIKELQEKCPLAKGFTLDSHKKELIDEAVEAAEAVDKKDWENLKEELGDVLWDWLTFCAIAEKEGKFTTKEVLEELKEKIKQRNPHVFGNQKITTLQEAQEAKRKAKQEWKAMKCKK